MKITEKAIDHLNYQLDDLTIDGTRRFQLSEFVISQDSMDVDLFQDNISKFNGTIKQILIKLQFYDRNISIISDNASLLEIFAALGKYNPHFGINSEYVYYRLFIHLISCLQGERIRSYSQVRSENVSKAGERGKILFQLEKLCQIFGVSMDESFDVADEQAIIQRISAHINDTMKSLHISNLFENQVTIISPNLKLTSQQQTIFDTMQDAIYQDFLIRRKMLLKRLDVTIQSFIWSEQAKGREDEILSAIKAQRENIVEEPSRYSFEEVLSAPVALIHESSKKVTEQKGGKKSLVKTIIIGAVPDRGGRTDDVRKTRLFEGHRGDRQGGYRGGNSGRGGDKHANKRGRY